jgi:uncharacterized membrane protein
MSEIDLSSAAALRVARIEPQDVWAALRAGLHDFRRAPAFGLVFGGVYVLIGLGIVGLTLASGQTLYGVALTLGFPLVAPFAAVGLYETSRRLELGQPLRWGAILGVVWAERGRQLPWFGAIMVVWFLFYLFFSHTLFALMLGLGAMSNPLDPALLLSPRGLAMIGAQLLVGGAFAVTIFIACVVSLPMMMDREVDFVTAMLTSIRAVATSPRSMLLWAVLIVALLAVALFPAFLGLFLVLPVLGHATWHLYRRVLPDGT